MFIGTNDLYTAWTAARDASAAANLTAEEAAAAEAQATLAEVPVLAARLASLLGYMQRELPATHLVVLGILPRGPIVDMATVTPDYQWPGVFTVPQQRTNSFLRCAARGGPAVPASQRGGLPSTTACCLNQP